MVTTLFWLLSYEANTPDLVTGGSDILLDHKEFSTPGSSAQHTAGKKRTWRTSPGFPTNFPSPYLVDCSFSRAAEGGEEEMKGQGN